MSLDGQGGHEQAGQAFCGGVGAFLVRVDRDEECAFVLGDDMLPDGPLDDVCETELVVCLVVDILLDGGFVLSRRVVLGGDLVVAPGTASGAA